MPFERTSSGRAEVAQNVHVLGRRGFIETRREGSIVRKTFRHVPGLTHAGWTSARARFIAAIQAQALAAAAGGDDAPVAPVQAIALDLTPEQPHREATGERPYYSWSLLQIVLLRYRASQDDLLHIAERICVGLELLRRECRRTHGNLKLENVLLDHHQEHLDCSQARIVLTDLRECAPDNPVQDEVQDLAQLGRILYQLLRGERYTEQQIASNPIELPRRTNRLTPKQLVCWTDICRRLMRSDQRDAGPYCLKSLQERLAEIRDTASGGFLAKPLTKLLALSVAFGWRAWSSAKSLGVRAVNAGAAATKMWSATVIPWLKQLIKSAGIVLRTIGLVPLTVMRVIARGAIWAAQKSKCLLFHPGLRTWGLRGGIATVGAAILALGIWGALRFVDYRARNANAQARGQWFVPELKGAFGDTGELRTEPELTNAFSKLPVPLPIEPRPSRQQLSHETEQLKQFKSSLKEWWERPALGLEDLKDIPLAERVDFGIESRTQSVPDFSSSTSLIDSLGHRLSLRQTEKSNAVAMRNSWTDLSQQINKGAAAWEIIRAPSPSPTVAPLALDLIMRREFQSDMRLDHTATIKFSVFQAAFLSASSSLQTRLKAGYYKPPSQWSKLAPDIQRDEMENLEKIPSGSEDFSAWMDRVTGYQAVDLAGLVKSNLGKDWYSALESTKTKINRLGSSLKGSTLIEAAELQSELTTLHARLTDIITTKTALDNEAGLLGANGRNLANRAGKVLTSLDGITSELAILENEFTAAEEKHADRIAQQNRERMKAALKSAGEALEQRRYQDSTSYCGPWKTNENFKQVLKEIALAQSLELSLTNGHYAKILAQVSPSKEPFATIRNEARNGSNTLNRLTNSLAECRYGEATNNVSSPYSHHNEIQKWIMQAHKESDHLQYLHLALDHGEYANIFKAFEENKAPQKSCFTNFLVLALAEHHELTNAQARLSRCDYALIESLTNDFARKEPFTNLLHQAHQEHEKVAPIQKLVEQKRWLDVSNSIHQLNQQLQKKQYIRDLLVTAEAELAKRIQPLTIPPLQVVDSTQAVATNPPAFTSSLSTSPPPETPQALLRQELLYWQIQYNVPPSQRLAPRILTDPTTGKEVKRDLSNRTPARKTSDLQQVDELEKKFEKLGPLDEEIRMAFGLLRKGIRLYR